MKYAPTARAQIADLRRHYRRKQRPEALQGLAAALRAAEQQISANLPGLPAPRPYPELAAPGEAWVQCGRYWIAYATTRPTFVKYIGLSGSLNNIILNAGQTTAYASEDNADKIAIINTATNLATEIDAIAPANIASPVLRHTGAATNNLVLGQDPRLRLVGGGPRAGRAVQPHPVGRAEGHGYPALRNHTALGVHEAAGQDATDND